MDPEWTDWDDVDTPIDDLRTAQYQIRRAIAQLETGGGDEHMALIAKSVLSQLRDYLKTVDKS